MAVTCTHGIKASVQSRRCHDAAVVTLANVRFGWELPLCGKHAAAFDANLRDTGIMIGDTYVDQTGWRIVVGGF